MSRIIYSALVVALLAGRAFADTTPAKAQMDDAEDRDGYERVWPSEVAKQVADLSTCQRIAKALGVKLAGSTTFCPVNWAWNDFAQQLGYHSSDPVGEMLNGVPADTLKTVLLSHVVPDTVLSSKSIKTGHATLSTAASTPANEVDITIRKLASGFLDVLYNSILDLNGDAQDMTEDDGLTMANLTFEGPFVAGTSTYIIHPVDEVMVPSSLAGKLHLVQAGNKKTSHRLSRRLLA